MKKRWVKIAAIAVALVLLFPIPMRYKDGGSVKYQAVLYSVTDVHRLAPGGGFEEGIVVEVLGMQVFSRLRPKVLYQGFSIDRSALSEESLQWLDWYHTLSEAEQQAVSFVPGDLNALIGGNPQPPQETQ